MAADKSDDPGVLGNLPRSRPGHRSDKRAGAGAAAAGAAAAGAAGAARAATGGAKAPARAAAKKTTASEGGTAKRAPRAPRTPLPPAPDHRSPDPLSGAVRLAGKVAEAGISTAGGLLRRLAGR